MSKIWLISDTHFGHDREFIWGPRGFDSYYEHDQALIENWNKIIDFEDEVYHLGDVMLGDNNYGISCLKQLKGNIHIILGNHDTFVREQLYNKCYNVKEVSFANRLKYQNYNFFLSHYPTLTDNFDEENKKPLERRVINLCGHLHTKDPFVDFDKGLIYHCEVDAHNCKPILIDNIINEIKNKINN